MYPSFEQIHAAHKAGAEVALALANAQFSAFAKLARLSSEAMKSTVHDSAAGMRAMLEVKDLQELMHCAAVLSPPAVRKAATYWKGVYEIATEANLELSKAMAAPRGGDSRPVAR